MVITRFKAKSQFKLDGTGTELELSLAIFGVKKEVKKEVSGGLKGA